MERRSLGRIILDYALSIFLPFLFSLLIWSGVVRLFRLWRVDPIWNWIIFSAILTSVFVLMEFSLPRITAWFSTIPDSTRQKSTPKSRWQRLLHALIYVVVIPFLISIAANSIPVQGGNTLLTIAIRKLIGREEYLFVRDIADTVIASPSIDTKLSGIEALRTLHTPAALDELFRIHSVTDSQYLGIEALYTAFVGAFASYEGQARNRLVILFHRSIQTTRGVPRGMNYNLYNRYFEDAFVGLQGLLAKEILDKRELETTQLEIDNVVLQLKNVLEKIQSERPREWQPTLNLVLDTFLEMDNLEYDPEIYSLAKAIAADPTYAEATRSDAMQLVAKLGSYKDFDLFLSFLDVSSPEPIKSAALQAIAGLHEKISGQSDSQKNEPSSK